MKQEKSCGAIVVDNGKLLLIKHVLGHWDLPKGHVENNETETETAIRELKEETNIDIEISDKFRYTIEYSPEEDVWKEVVYFIAKPTSYNIIPQEEEVQIAEWVNIEEAINKVTYDSAREVLKKVIEDLEM